MLTEAADYESVSLRIVTSLSYLKLQMCRLCSYLVLDDFDEKQNVTDTSAEKSHLFALPEKSLSRRL